MRVQPEFLRHDFIQAVFHLARIFPRRQSNAVGDPENMRIDRDRRFAEGDVQHDIRRLSSHARKCFQRLAIARHLAPMLIRQSSGKGDHVLRLGAVEPDRLDRVAQIRFTQRDHLFRRVDS